MASLWYNPTQWISKNWVKKEVSALKAYNAKEIPCRIKLDANESPSGLQIQQNISRGSN